MFWRRHKAPLGFEEKQERRIDTSVRTMIGGLAVSGAVGVFDLLSSPQGEGAELYMYGAILAGEAVASAGVIGLAATGAAGLIHRSRERRQEQNGQKALEETKLTVDLAYANWREDQIAYSVTPPDQG